MNAPATTERIHAAIAALGAGALDEASIAEHVAPLFTRVLARNRERSYLANHSLGRPLDALDDDVARGACRLVHEASRRVGRVGDRAGCVPRTMGAADGRTPR